jgi:hypothetical protein
MKITMDVETTRKGIYIVIGAGSDKTSPEYLRLLEMAAEKHITIIGADEAKELNLNVPDDILKDHAITITNAEPIIPLKDLDLDLEIKMVKRDYGFDPTSVKRGKGKHRKTYQPPYKYHR